MERFKRIKSKAKQVSNSGFGDNSSNFGGRFFDKNGKSNVQKSGNRIFDRISFYHSMLEMPLWKFLLILFLFYIIANFLFALLYYAIGIEHLVGIAVASSELVKFSQAYFFSAQTFTTVGYGHISPSGFATSAIAAAEALIGLLSFAIATGLFFGRFSKPTLYLKFSENAVIAPYKDETALMLRLVPYKNTNYIDAQASVTLGMTIEENGVLVNRFFILDLEMDKVNSLSLNWTLVHPITENSPLYEFTAKDFATIRGEIFVIIKTFDDMFSTTVATRTSYTFNEIVYGAKFDIMFTRSTDATRTILHLDKINAFAKTDLS
jgi:Inward rectifier potassium channel C-terminal domain/Ion channel